MFKSFNLNVLTVALLAFSLCQQIASADTFRNAGNWSPQRVDAHAPIGVMGDHTHSEGEIMLSYRFMRMHMDGLRAGSRRIPSADVLARYMVAPLKMDMDMHMLGAMYAPTESVTLMLMVPYTEVSMDHLTRMGQSFTTNGTGLDDISLTALVRFLDTGMHRMHFHAGLSLPSGDIDIRDDTPAMANARLPYPMQLGSGTYDLLPGLTYVGQADFLSWGAQLRGTIRLDENSNNYSLGNRLESSVWGAVPLRNWLSTSLRLAYHSWGSIDGSDPTLNPMMVSTADTANSGGERMDAGVGINLLLPDGPFVSARLATELLFPIYQEVRGQQLETDLTWTLGLQVAF